MCSFGIEELFELYKSIYQKARNEGLDDKEAGERAKSEVCEICPDICSGEGYKPGDKKTKFWSMVGGYRYSIRVKDAPVETALIESTAKEKEDSPFFEGLNWTDCWRHACATGFVPYAEYVDHFLPRSKTRQWSAYKNFMQAEGWVFEDSEFGWKVTSPKIARKLEIIDEIRKLQNELRGLD